jgi:hypothetical protein
LPASMWATMPNVRSRSMGARSLRGGGAGSDRRAGSRLLTGPVTGGRLVR